MKKTNPSKAFIRAKIGGKYDSYSLTELGKMGREGRDAIVDWVNSKLFPAELSPSDIEEIIVMLEGHGVVIITTDDITDDIVDELKGSRLIVPDEEDTPVKS